MFGEKLKQHAVRHPPVNDDDGLNACFDNFDAAFNLRDHAARNRAVLYECARFVRRQPRQEFLVLVEYAGNVGKQQEALGLHAGGQRGGKTIGVDI